MTRETLHGIYRKDPSDPNGIYFAIIVVPADVRHIIGKSKLTKSTGTSDRAKAYEIGLPVVARFNRMIDEARRRTRAFTDEQIKEVVSEFIASERASFQSWLATNESGPEAVLWTERSMTRYLAEPNNTVIKPTIVVEDGITYEQTELGVDRAAEYLTDAMKKLRIAPTHPSYFAVREAVRKARYELAAQNVGGSIVSRRSSAVSPMHSTSDAPAPDSITFADLVARWRTRNPNKPRKTGDKFALAFRRLEAYLNHDDARRVTRRDINNWVDAALEGGESIANIRTHVNGISAIFSLADDDFPINPASRIRLNGDRQPRQRHVGYTEQEAREILLEARTQDDPVRVGSGCLTL